MPFEPILAGAVAITVFAEVAVVGDLWVRRTSIANFAVFPLFIGAYVFFGLWLSLLPGFYSGPDPHGADDAEASVVMANLVLGGILALILRSCHFSSVARRCVFYVFTVPAWIFLFSLAVRGFQLRIKG